MRILLADDDATRVHDLARALAEDTSIEVVRLVAGEFLADAVAACAPDVVIVDMGRPDRDALEGVRQLAVHDPRPIVLFMDEDDPDFMETAIAAGVSSYNVLGTPLPDVKPILRAAVALFRRHQQAQHELQATRTKLQERDLIDGAKAILIRERRLSEPEAHRWLQRQAMATGRRIADIAGQIMRDRQETIR